MTDCIIFTFQSKTGAKDDKEVEKQWQLQKKVFDLTAQMSQLDKRVAALKEENEILVVVCFNLWLMMSK